MNNLIGQQLGPYRIMEQIGTGGMATVYRAYQPAMERDVAIKVIASHFAQEEEFLKRFRREAKAVAQLEHAHILPVYDYGEVEGRPYLVMRYLEAGALKDRMAEKPLPLGEVNRIVGQVGSALDYAHRMGIVHRDVKPANVLVDSEGNAFLTDFGLAKMIGGSARLTGTGVGIGTPVYMSPEQGQAQKVDSRTDIYSLGVMLYEMVTGQVPYDADTPLAVVLKHINEPLPLPGSVRPDLPEQVERVILRAMAKEPDDRYQTAGEMVRALDAAVRAAEAAAPTEPKKRTMPMPSGARPAPQSGERRLRLPRWVGWVVGGVAALASLALMLRWVPLRVQISGGQLEVVRLVEGTATPAGVAVAEGTAEPTVLPAAGSMAVPTARPTTEPGPTPTPISSSLPPAVAALRWERLYAGANLALVNITTLAVDPSDPDTMFAGTWGAGIYVSHDGGRTWTPSSAGLGKGTVGSVVIDPSDPAIVYASLFDQGGVYKSLDGGKTWGAMNRGVDLDNVGGYTDSIYLDPAASSTLYLTGASNGLYYSDDGGAIWQRRGQDLMIKDLAIDPDDSEHLYASTSGHKGQEGVYESHDGGHTWKRLTTDEMFAPGDDFGGDWWHLAADPEDFGILYASGAGGMYRTSDGGQSWTPVLDNRCRWLVVSDVALYCGQNDGMLISLDDGQSWSQISHGAGGSGAEAKPFTIAPGDPYTLYAGVDAVAKSTDGGWTWTRIGRLDAAAHLRLTVDPRDTNRLFLTGGDLVCQVFRSEDGGQTWRRLDITSCGGGRMTIDPLQDVIYFPVGFDELHRSRDNGQTWERFGSGYIFDPVQVVPVQRNAERLWLLNRCNVRPALSVDGGETFEMVESFPNNVCDAILLVHTDGRRMYVVDQAETYRSDDGGETWQSLGGLGGTYRAGVLDPSNPDVVYAGSTHRGVLKTENGGLTWREASSGLTSLSINELAIDPADPRIIYAATDGGAFVSVDGGEHWWPIQEGLGPNRIVYSIAADPNDSSKVYAVTPDGVFRLVGGPPSVTTCAPAPTGLVAWWSADGHTSDIVSSNDGELVNGATFAPGKAGQAFSFDGVDDFVQVPDSDLWTFGTGDFTIALWANFSAVKPSTDIGHPAAVLIGHDEGPGHTNKWWFAFGAGFLHFTTSHPTIDPYPFLAQVPFSPTLNRWYHLAVGRSGDTYTIFVDGLPVSSEVFAGAIPNASAPLTIGQAESGLDRDQQFFMNGRIDEVMIFNRALSEEEIRAIATADSSGICAPSTHTPPSTSVLTFTDQNDFQAAIAGMGDPTVIDFEDIDAGPTSDTFVGRDPFDGDTYAARGITFSNPYKFRLYIAPGGLVNPAGSLWNTSNSLSVGQFPNDSNAFDTTDDDLFVTLDPPVVAIGFTLVDIVGSSGDEFARFVDTDGYVIEQVPLPPGSDEFRAFVGIVSVERPVAAVNVVEAANDGDDVNYDDFIFVP